MTTYKQHIVCTGVKSRLQTLFPGAQSHHAYSCLRCQKKEKNQTDLCRFKGRPLQTPFTTCFNFLL